MRVQRRLRVRVRHESLCARAATTTMRATREPACAAATTRVREALRLQRVRHKSLCACRDDQRRVRHARGHESSRRGHTRASELRRDIDDDKIRVRRMHTDTYSETERAERVHR